MTDLERGVDLDQLNKQNSGFCYRLKLPAVPANSNNEKLKAKLNVLDLNALRFQSFKCEYAKYAAFA